ncbi:hypothetical protein CF8_0120 [Aeromonas phage CF8]|nr:hypothetical protein CF8_0120 [Aeromonas phage CF8]
MENTNKEAVQVETTVAQVADSAALDAVLGMSKGKAAMIGGLGALAAIVPNLMNEEINPVNIGTSALAVVAGATTAAFVQVTSDSQAANVACMIGIGAAVSGLTKFGSSFAAAKASAWLAADKADTEAYMQSMELSMAVQDSQALDAVTA